MTTVQINLPVDLTQKAASAGLVSAKSNRGAAARATAPPRWALLTFSCRTPDELKVARPSHQTRQQREQLPKPLSYSVICIAWASVSSPFSSTNDKYIGAAQASARVRLLQRLSCSQSCGIHACSGLLQWVEGRWAANDILIFNRRFDV
jgi:hypothetical protein